MLTKDIQIKNFGLEKERSNFLYSICLYELVHPLTCATFFAILFVPLWEKKKNGAVDDLPLYAPED